MAKAAHTQGSERDHPAPHSAPERPPNTDAAGAGESAAEAGEPAVEIDVARTGGFAGITRRWTAQPPQDEASDWISLIDRCPWDRVAGAGDSDDAEGAPNAPRMPDRFVWWIRASWTGADPREAEVPDDELTGAWRELVDAVRESGRAVERPDRRGS